MNLKKTSFKPKNLTFRIGAGSRAPKNLLLQKFRGEKVPAFLQAGESQHVLSPQGGFPVKCRRSSAHNPMACCANQKDWGLPAPKALRGALGFAIHLSKFCAKKEEKELEKTSKGGSKPVNFHFKKGNLMLPVKNQAEESLGLFGTSSSSPIRRVGGPSGGINLGLPSETIKSTHTRGKAYIC